jgi:hypothetical protein
VKQSFKPGDGSAMAQAVSCRPLTAGARVGPCGIYDGQSGSGTNGFIYELFRFPCQYNSTVAFRRLLIYHLRDEQYAR